MTTITEYYSTLYANVPGYWVTINSFDKAVPIQEPCKVENLANEIARLAAKRCSLFHTFGVFRSPPKIGRGTKNDVCAVVAVYLDVDLADTGRYADTKNPSADLQTIKATLSGWGLPTPSAIVATGNGYHFEYRLSEPAIFADSKSREEVADVLKGFGAFAQEKGRAIGWKLDSVTDLARLKRALGSQNFKDPDQPKQVSLVEFDPSAAYPLDLLGTFKSSNDSSASPRAKSVSKAIDRLPVWETIAAHCPFVRNCVENAATLSYPDWLAVLGIAARCEDGRQKAHDLSRLDPRYKAAETDAKIDETLKVDGAVTYGYIQDALGFDVSGDPLTSRMHSPIQYGFADPALIEVLKRTVFDLKSERFYDLTTLQPFSRNSFDMRYGSRLASPYVGFKGSALSIKAAMVDYLPGSPLLVGTGPHPTLNVYRRPALVASLGTCDTILGHFDKLIPDPTERGHVLSYLACMVQQPATKLTTALLLIGPQGNGKSTIIRWMEQVLGETNVKTLTAEAISSRFQADRTNLQLMVLNEVMGVDRAGANALKSWITEERMEVEEKGTPRFAARTPRGVILISNHVDGLNLEETDRRYAVIDTCSQRPDDAYFQKLNDAADKELAAFAHHLANRDLGTFNPRAPAPETDLKKLMRKVTQSPLEGAIQSAFENEDGCFKRDFMTAEEVISTVLACGFEHRRPAPGSVGAILKQMGFVALQQQRVPGHGKPRFWIVRNAERWMSAEAAEIAAHYVASFSGINDNSRISMAA